MPAGRMYKYKPKKLNNTQVKQVQKIINKDKIYHEIFQSVGDEANTTGFLYNVFAVAEGNDFNQRESDKIHAKHMEMKLVLTQTDTNANGIRIIVARSKIGHLITSDFPAWNGQPDLTIMQILYDNILVTPALQPNAPITVAKFKYSFKTKKIPHLNIGYVDTDSATAPAKNGVYVYVVGSLAEASTANVINGWIKGHFYDSGQ